MKRFALLLAVVSSVAMPAAGATRPHYGGTLRATTEEVLPSLDPVIGNSIWHRNLTALLFDTLVTIDQQNRIQPALATSWRGDPGDQRWTFVLRPQVVFHDGTPVTSDSVAASLRTAQPGWKIYATSDSVVIETSAPTPNLPAELAENRNAIAKRDGLANIVGTGPFRVTSWTPGKQLTATAHTDYWNGRAFVDSIQVDMGVPSREQVMALELGKIQVADLVPEQAHRAAMDGDRIVASFARELVALVFTRGADSSDEANVREVLSLAIDRNSIGTVLLGGSGEPAGSLLPNWMTGYAFVFEPTFNLQDARERRTNAGKTPHWSLAYDSADPMARTLAERVELNAQDVGISLHMTSVPNPDIRLVRIPFASPDPEVALNSFSSELGISPPKQGKRSAEDLYHAESAILEQHMVIPLVFLPARYVIAASVQDWSQTRLGTWQPQNIWLAGTAP